MSRAEPALAKAGDAAPELAAAMEAVIRLVHRAAAAGVPEEIVHKGLFGSANDVKLLALACWGLLPPPPGPQHSHKGTALIDELIAGMLANCFVHNIPPPFTLCALYEDHHRIPWSLLAELRDRGGGLLRVQEYCRSHPGASVAQVAKETGVSRRTIARYRDANLL